jgi:hypothetical protein
MHRLLAVIGLALIVATPAWADSHATRSKSRSAQEKQPHPKSQSNALGGWNRGDPRRSLLGALLVLLPRLGSRRVRAVGATQIGLFYPFGLCSRGSAITLSSCPFN